MNANENQPVAPGKPKTDLSSTTPSVSAAITKGEGKSVLVEPDAPSDNVHVPRQKALLEISKDFEFEAAHSLPHLPCTHKCHNMHGHSYKVRVTCSGEIDPVFGWVIDYGDISAAMRPILTAIDHTNIDLLFRGALNPERKCKSEQRRDKPSTAENLCIWLYRQLKPTLPSLVAIEVKETASSNVVYRP